MEQRDQGEGRMERRGAQGRTGQKQPKDRALGERGCPPGRAAPSCGLRGSLPGDRSWGAQAAVSTCPWPCPPPGSPPSACLLLLDSWGPSGSRPQRAAPLSGVAQSRGGRERNRPDSLGACASFSGQEPWPSLDGGRRETPETRFPPGVPLETLLCYRGNQMGLQACH